VSDPEALRVRRDDREHLWHPFTQMREYADAEPLVVVRGEGHCLVDDEGRRLFDATSALWCNLFGHQVPEIDAAIRDQLGLAYYVGAQNFVGLAPGYFAFYCGTAPEQSSRVEQEMLKEADLLRIECRHRSIDARDCQAWPALRRRRFIRGSTRV
jgi:hypothetical protein